MDKSYVHKGVDPRTVKQAVGPIDFVEDVLQSDGGFLFGTEPGDLGAFRGEESRMNAFASVKTIDISECALRLADDRGPIVALQMCPNNFVSRLVVELVERHQGHSETSVTK